MALTAAGSGHGQLAMVAGIICAATVLFSLTVLATTIHRDNLEHHNIPSLLNDSWEVTPAFARRRGAPTAIEPHRAG
ncbi:hypothetical protein JK358_05315 [Nocardia sp. 2]|uniref:Uncharacterized protein n=1 Tax=Nocardia acididurans TaxID=2802282 RepID=A0ABS1LZY3_9NOCA|nr:hypothetical protein [Nocardia acididurans]MBL1073805.1 hypothetical protein [Nocardia acididurans]